MRVGGLCEKCWKNMFLPKVEAITSKRYMIMGTEFCEIFSVESSNVQTKGLFSGPYIGSLGGFMLGDWGGSPGMVFERPFLALAL